MLALDRCPNLISRVAMGGTIAVITEHAQVPLAKFSVSGVENPVVKCCT
jgi:hypothetical protein